MEDVQDFTKKTNFIKTNKESTVCLSNLCVKFRISNHLARIELLLHYTTIIR